ncbi:hypothetical protein Hanom_Chr13g01235081 [Helianthus anomalus]
MAAEIMGYYLKLCREIIVHLIERISLDPSNLVLIITSRLVKRLVLKSIIQ